MVIVVASVVADSDMATEVFLVVKLVVVTTTFLSRASGKILTPQANMVVSGDRAV